MAKTSVRTHVFSTTLLGTVTMAVILVSILPAIADDAEDKCRSVTLQLMERKLKSSYFNIFTRSPYHGTTNDLVRAADMHIAGCAANGGKATLCNDFQRATGASNQYPAQIDTFGLNQQTCNIERNGRVLDAEADAPVDPYDEALWRSEYEYLQWLQGRCETYNDGRNKYTDQDSPSPFKKKLESSKANDRKWVAQQLELANEDAVGPLENYVDKHCRANQLKMLFNGLKASCNESGESSITVSGVPQSVPTKTGDLGPGPDTTEMGLDRRAIDLQTLLIRLSDWGVGRITNDTEPFQIGPGKMSHDNSVRGSCNACCSDETSIEKAYLFGGPDQSIIVGQTDVSLKCDKADECGIANGDPHICTYDRLNYDFQGVGEFVLARTDGFEAQARFEPFNDSRFISVNTAVAARFGEDRIALYAGDPARLTVNGEDMELKVGSTVTLPGGTTARRVDRLYGFSKGGFAVEAKVTENRLQVIRVGVPSSTAAGGLFGDRDDDNSDDLRLPAGSIFKAPVTFEDLYNSFGRNWRVTVKTSLFDYKPGESVESFYDPDLPMRRVSVANLPESTVSNAEQACRIAGIRDKIVLDNCIYDITLTGDETFAEDAAEQDSPRARLVLANDQPEPRQAVAPDGVKIELPSEAIASFNIKIKVTGPAQKSFQVRFAPVGGRNDASVDNPYSEQVLAGGDEVLTIHVPYQPGEYELRYLSPYLEEKFLSIPFRSLAPRVEIEAPLTAEAGKFVDVRVIGDVSPNSKINIVPIGSPVQLVGAHAFMKGGVDETVRVYDLPKEPGEYEIRFASATPHVIYGSKRLTIK